MPRLLFVNSVQDEKNEYFVKNVGKCIKKVDFLFLFLCF